jgi:Protein of unknown function (DUF1236)
MSWRNDDVMRDSTSRRAIATKLQTMSFSNTGLYHREQAENPMCGWVASSNLWRTTMTTMKSLTVLAALLAGGTSLAMAQNGRAPGSEQPMARHHCVGIRQGLTECSTTHMSANSNMSANSSRTSQRGSDTVILSAAQRTAAWNALSKQATNQNVAGFDATIGTFVPSNVKIEPIPSKATANNPQLRPYDYAMVDHDLVIVDPTNKVIADVWKG